MEVEPLTSSTTSQSPRQRFMVIAIVVYCVAAIVHVIPSFYFAAGLQALGAAWGWWRGDPSITDASGYLVVGLLGFAIIAGIATTVLTAVGARFAVSSRRAVLVGTAFLLVGPILLCASFVT
jgi:hypothetical protein